MPGDHDTSFQALALERKLNAHKMSQLKETNVAEQMNVPRVPLPRTAPTGALAGGHASPPGGTGS